jgi:hypothetical protein
MKGKLVVPGVVGAALATLLLWVLNLLTGIKADIGIEAALTTVLTVIVSLMTPDRMEADDSGPSQNGTHKR